MCNGLNKIGWKQNKIHLSEVFIKLNYSSDKVIKFSLEEEIINHLFSKRTEEIEIHFKFSAGNGGEVFPVDFSKLRRIKPVYPLLRQGIALPKIQRKRNDKAQKTGTYAIFHKDSMRWLGKEGWSASRIEFDIIPEKIVTTFLGVTITPQEAVDAGAQWRIEDGAWQNSAASIPVTTKAYLIEFKEILGWTNPRPEQVQVVKGIDEKIGVEYSLYEPKFLEKNKFAIAALLALFLVAAGLYYVLRPNNGKIMADISPSDVAQVDAKLERNSTFNIEYKKKPLNAIFADRSITIHIRPAAANQAGAQWKIKGPGNWKSSGETLSGLINIPYTVIFRNIDGWKKPENKEITIKGPGNISGEGVYETISKLSKTYRP